MQIIHWGYLWYAHLAVQECERKHFKVPALSVEGAFVSLEAGPPARIWIKAWENWSLWHIEKTGSECGALKLVGDEAWLAQNYW